jgi:hypothetical protein
VSACFDLLIGYIDCDRASHAYEVAFKSLSEDKIHPEAASPLVKALDNQINPQLFSCPYTQTMIFGDYYGLFCKYARKADGGLVDFLQIWNWKSKDAQVSQSPLVLLWLTTKLYSQCLEIFDADHETMNFSFLTNDRFLVANARELMLFSLDTVDSIIGIRLIAKFSFPALRDPFSSHFITFNIPFHASTHNQLIAINMCMSAPTTTKSPYFTFYIERNAILELESTYISHYGEASQGSPNLPWSAWGSKYTRFFENSYSNSCVHRIFGFRSAELIGDLFSREGEPQPRLLRIRDFNPHRVTDFKAGNITTSHQRLVEGDTPNSTLFLEPLGSGLPYLETISQEKFLASDMIMEANRIMLLSLKVVSHHQLLIADTSLIKMQEDWHVSHSIKMLDFE